MTVVSIETGSGEGFTAQVNAEGRMLSDVEEMQRIVEPVTTRPEIMNVATTTPSVTTSSSEVVASRTNRRWLEIQNLGDFAVHFVLASSATAATTSHRRLNPGEVFSWRDGVAYQGAVQAIASGGPSQLAVMEFYSND